MRGLLQSDHHVRRLNRMQDQESEKNGTTNEKEYIIQSLCKEVERLHEKNSILQEAHASNVRQMEHRFFSRQRQLQQRLSTKEDNIRYERNCFMWSAHTPFLFSVVESCNSDWNAKDCCDNTRLKTEWYNTVDL